MSNKRNTNTMPLVRVKRETKAALDKLRQETGLTYPQIIEMAIDKTDADTLLAIIHLRDRYECAKCGQQH